ncbi:MAG: TraL conjugative transposon family protein [Tannerellaceae bacterium]|jgi:hypothetical protein|nr:TraL conjugative transposon family protein [Tannerellaceae bacterium]
MKKKTGNFMEAVRSGIEYRLRWLCGRPSPLKRFIAILVIGGMLTVANIDLVVSSIYNIGRKDAETEFMELRHIETLKLQQQKDSLDFLRLKMEKLHNKNRKKYEYE